MAAVPFRAAILIDSVAVRVIEVGHQGDWWLVFYVVALATFDLVLVAGHEIVFADSAAN